MNGGLGEAGVICRTLLSEYTSEAGIDDEEQKICAAGEVQIRDAHDLPRRGAVDESFAVKTCRRIGAPARGGSPRPRLSNVHDTR